MLKREQIWIAFFKVHCMKSVRIRSYSGPYFPAFGLNADQNNSEYGHFLRSGESYLFVEINEDTFIVKNFYALRLHESLQQNMLIA